MMTEVQEQTQAMLTTVNAMSVLLLALCDLILHC